jgi:hypothetical protein
LFGGTSTASSGSSASSAASTSTGTSSSTGSGGNGGGGGTGGEAPFSPGDLPGLALWLDSDIGVVEDPMIPGKVVRWLDQSGNGLQAESVGDSASPNLIDPAVLNGHDAIRCARGNPSLWIDDDPVLRWGTGEFAIAMVMRVGTQFSQNQPAHRPPG